MKIRVGVLYGGKATEHEVSVITAVQAMRLMGIHKTTFYIYLIF